MRERTLRLGRAGAGDLRWIGADVGMCTARSGSSRPVGVECMMMSP